jgi:arachidonate 15-lipoxygenase
MAINSFIDASNTFLGHSSGRQSCCIDIVASKYNPEFREFFVEIEQEMMDKFDARPHWGKIFIDSNKMYDKYDPESIRKFLAVREQYDPNRTFLNEFLEDWFRLPPLKDQTSDEIEEVSIIAEASVKSTLDLNKSKYIELLSDGSGIEPSLPQHSMHKQSRKNTLAKVREGYQYEHHYYHNKCVGIPKKFPLTKHFAVSIKYVSKALRSLARGTAKYYWRYLTWSKASTGSGYGPLNDFGRKAPLPGPTSYCNDKVFGWQRLSGLDPMSLRRITKLDQVPNNVNQAITNSILMQQLNRRTDLEAEVNNGNVFFVDYSIFNQIGHAIQRGEVKKDEKQFIAAPYCLMIFDGETLVPVAIEINNNVFTPVQGERWELAKFFVQVAAVNHHGLCAHEYGQHAMIGAFSVATPRHLHKEHPVYVLLEPHLNFSVAHTAFSSAEMRFNTQIPFMTPTKLQMKKLVEVAYEKWTFTDLDFDYSLTDRGVEQYPKVYPYRDDGKLIWTTLAKFVTEYVCTFYKSNNDVKKDWELQNWISELQSHNGGNIRGLIWNDKKMLDNRKDLVRLLTRIIFLAGPHHAVIHFSQLDFFSDALNLMSGCSMISSESITDSLTADTTSKNSTSTTLLKKALPSPYLAMKQAMTFEYGNIHYDHLGDYKNFTLDKVDQVRPFVREFQYSLQQIEKIIEDRAQKRFLPNSYLKPSAIPNSTNV